VKKILRTSLDAQRYIARLDWHEYDQDRGSVSVLLLSTGEECIEGPRIRRGRGQNVGY